MLWALYAFGSAVFNATGNIVSKKILAREHALEYGASQGVYALLLVLALPFIPLGYSWQTYISLYVISLILTLANLYYLKSVRHSELSATIPLMNISPLFLLVIAFVLLKEMPDALAILGVFLLVVGMYLLQLGVARTKHLLQPFITLAKSRYSLYMIFAVLILSFVATMEKAVLNTGIHFLTIFVIVRLFLGVNYILLESYRHGYKEIIKDLKTDGWPVFGSTVSSIFSDVFFFLALSVPGALVSLVIPVKRLSTFLSALIGGKLFHEAHLGRKLIGCGVMLVGVILVVL